MEPVLRPARPEDKAAIAAFTQGTFPWGDYIERRFDDWLGAPSSLTVVAEVAGEAVAIARERSSHRWKPGRRACECTPSIGGAGSEPPCWRT